MTRYYKHAGIEKPSVTTIMADCTDKSMWLTPWKINLVLDSVYNCFDGEVIDPHEEQCLVLPVSDWELVCKEAKEEADDVSRMAMDIGSRVHESVEQFFLYRPYGSADANDKAFDNCIKAFRYFVNDYSPTHEHVEQKVYSDWWAGTLDFIGTIIIDGQECKYVLDWKTCSDKAFKSHKKSIPENYRVQIAAYRSTQANDLEIGSGVVLLNKESGEYFFKDCSKFYEKDKAVFEAMVTLWYTRHNRIAKKAGWTG